MPIKLDTFYSKIIKQIKLVEAYTEIKYLTEILVSCRLKPIEYLQKSNTKLDLYREWIDEFDCKLSINKKNINIEFNCVDNNFSYINTDLYYNLSLNKILSISNKVLVLSCLRNDNKQMYFITSLGIDNYFRTYYFSYENNIWKQISNLFIGIENLQYFIKNKDVAHSMQVNKIKEINFPCSIINAWLISMPANEAILQQINKQDSLIAELLNER